MRDNIIPQCRTRSVDIFPSIEKTADCVLGGIQDLPLSRTVLLLSSAVLCAIAQLQALRWMLFQQKSFILP